MTSLIEGPNPILSRWINTYDLKIDGLIHVGAHLVQERNYYQENRFEPICWIEAIPEIAVAAANLLKGYQNQQLINATLWSSPGKNLDLHVTNGEGGSSSLYSLYLHQSSHPDVKVNTKITLSTQILDNLGLGNGRFNTLVLDTQGSELEILRGGEKTLSQIDQIICELSIRELYKGAPKHKKVIAYLESIGFILVAADVNRTVGWGDGLFIRSEKIIGKSHNVISENIKFHGRRFTVGTLVRYVLIRTNLYKILSMLIGRA
jgi:FkbM family methyltransferase